MPSVTLVRDQLEWWRRFWEEKPSLEVFHVWRRTYAKLLLRDPKERWQLVEGPIGATIATLFDIGFKPKLPNKWEISKPNGIVK